MLSVTNILHMSTLYVVPDPDDIQAYVTAEIRAWMGRRGMNQTQLADALGISQSQMSKRLKGKVPITVPEMGKIAASLGIDPVVLLGGDVGPNGGPGFVRHQGLEPRTRCFQDLNPEQPFLVA